VSYDFAVWRQRPDSLISLLAAGPPNAKVLSIGYPVERDNLTAEAYFREALANGHPDAKAALRLISKEEITLEAKKKAWSFWNPRC
jgi:hypothetical protein